jgi:hypothetical protein
MRSSADPAPGAGTSSPNGGEQGWHVSEAARKWCSVDEEFVPDSLLEEAGFEPSVPRDTTKVRTNAEVMAFLSAADTAGLFLSVLTLGELRKGVEAKRRTDSVTAASLGVWVDGIETTFADRVLPVDGTVNLAGPAALARTDRGE